MTFTLTSPAPAPYLHEFDVFELAERHGLKPRRAGRRVRFFCPSCGDDGTNRRKGRTASASLEVEGQPWHCWRASCDVRGTARSLAVLLGELSPLESGPAPPRPARPAPPPRPAPARSPREIDVAAAWGEILASATSEGWEELAAWARGRGWPEAVVQAVVLSDEVASVDASRISGSEGRRLARLCEKARRPILIPIRDGSGVVRQAARRWNGTGTAPRPKSLSLPSEVTGPGEAWGGVWCYGSIPAAVDAAEAGEPIFIVEGAPDYLAASGVLASECEPGAVLGFYSTSTAQGVVRAIVDALGARSVIAPRIVIVAHNDTLSAQEIERGETVPIGRRVATTTAAALRGRAGVHFADLPSGVDDLSDLLALEGSARLLGLLRTARCEYPQPVHLREAPEEMSSRFRRVVVEATNRSSIKRHTLVVFEVPPGVGKSYNALRTAAQIVSGEFQIPINGRRPRGWPEGAPWPPRERSVVFATHDHALGDEKVEELAELAPGTRARHIYGLLHYCSFASNVEPVFPSVGRRGICGQSGDQEQRCPHASTCPGAQDPKAYRGEVTFLPHALIPKVAADLVIVDESPGVVALDSIEAERVVSLFACRMIPRVLRWVRFRNPAASDAARSLCDLIAPLAYEHAARASAGEIEPYSRRIWGEELLALLDSRPALFGELEEGFGTDAVPPPVPFPAEARAGVHAMNHMPSRPAFGALRDLSAYYRRLRHGPAVDPLGLGEDLRPPEPVCSIRLDTDGRWSLEVRRVRALPKAPVVVLDATGDLTLAEWQAAYPDRRVVIRSLDVQGAAPARAVHMDSPHFSRRHLLGGDGAVRPDAVPRIAKVLEELARLSGLARPRFEGSPPVRLGILTHKPIADALAGEGRVALAGGGPQLREAVLELERRGFEFRSPTGASLFGWFGRHDRGTNAFEAVDGFAVLGDPFGNLGDIDADAFLLGLQAEEIAEARAAATCRQAIARARHIRRNTGDRVVLIFAGREPPDVPGVAWVKEQIRGGAPLDESTVKLGDLCVHVAATAGALGLPVLERFDRRGTPWEGFGPAAVPLARRRRIVEKVIRHMGWTAYAVKVPTGQVKIGAPSREAAEAWAISSGLLDPPEPSECPF